MGRWKFTIIFALFGAFFSWIGYISMQVMFIPGVIGLLPTIPVIEVLNWGSTFEFYHSGNPVDHLGMVKIILIEAIEFGLLGWCVDLIKYRKTKAEKQF